MRTKKKKARRRGLRILFLLTIACLIIAYLLSLPIFQIKDVVVNGAEMLLPEQIRTLAAIPLGENLFYVDLARSKANLKKISAIKSVRFYRLPPGTILINVTERKPAASIIFPNKSVFIDRDGYILNQNENIALDISDLADLPVVSGLSERAILETNQIDQEMTGLVFQIISRLEGLLKETKLKIDLGNFDQISFMLDDLLLVKVGTIERIGRKMEVFEHLLPQVAGQWEKVSYLDVRYPDSPVIRFR